MYYVFQNIDEETNVVSYGFVPEEKAQDKTLMEEIAFAKIETLPTPPENSDGKEYFLKYDESKKEFYFEL
jgi:hypothetical protein